MTNRLTALWRKTGVDPEDYVGHDASENEAAARAGFVAKAKRYLNRLPMARRSVAMYFCMLDPKTPVWVKATVGAALAYFVLPLDAIPDLLPLVGLSDDASVLAAALTAVSAYVTTAHRERPAPGWPTSTSSTPSPTPRRGSEGQRAPARGSRRWVRFVKRGAGGHRDPVARGVAGGNTPLSGSAPGFGREGDSLADLLVREATAADLPAIRAIYNHYVADLDVYVPGRPETEADRLAWFKARSASHPAVVAEAGTGGRAGLGVALALEQALRLREDGRGLGVRPRRPATPGDRPGLALRPRRTGEGRGPPHRHRRGLYRAGREPRPSGAPRLRTGRLLPRGRLQVRPTARRGYVQLML